MRKLGVMSRRRGSSSWTGGRSKARLIQDCWAVYKTPRFHGSRNFFTEGRVGLLMTRPSELALDGWPRAETYQRGAVFSFVRPGLARVAGIGFLWDVLQ